MQETKESWVRSLGWENLLEERIATHSSILAWRISMDREKPGRLQSKGSQRVGLARVTKHSTAPLLLVLSATKRI